MRVVVDTNVLVSGLISPYGPPRKVIDAVLEGWLIPLASKETFTELQEVLRRPALARPLAKERADVPAFLRDYAAIAQWLTPPPTTLAVRDEKDRPFLALAECAGPGTVLVSGDRDLHAVAAGASFRVLTPSRLVTEFITARK